VKPDFNSRIRRVPHSPTLEIHQRVGDLRARGSRVIHLGFGESPFPVPRPVVAALRRKAADSRYLPSQGSAELRCAAARYLRRRFGHDADAARIVVGPGSKELIFDVLLALEGDLILPSPSWVSYAPQGRLLGKRVIWAGADPAAGWRLTGTELEAACRRSRSTQKLMVLNSPCNPTAAVYSAGKLREIARVARRHNVIVVSDEIYAEITFRRGAFTSIARFCPERTIVTTGMSKGFCAGGYRLGIVSVPRGMEEVVRGLVRIASETFSCVAAPVQSAAVAAFDADRAVRAHIRDTVAIHRIAGDYLWRALVGIGLRCPRPEGAFYLFPDFFPFARELRRRGIRTDADLCGDLLERKHVAMLPGVAFGVAPGELAVRVASVDYDGAAALSAFRRKRPSTTSEGKAFIEKHCPNLPEGVRRIGEYLGEIALRGASGKSG
jgi:aspartate aminotransferase